MKMELREAFKEDELCWSQKVMITWLQEGFKNTQFFHVAVKNRRKRNIMLQLQKVDGSWTTFNEEIGWEVVKYCKELLALMAKMI